MNYNRKIPALLFAGLVLILYPLFAWEQVGAFPPRQFGTPLNTPTVESTRLPSATPSTIITEQAIKIPSDSSLYVVKSGDSLWTIATKVYGNGAQYILIQKANNLSNNQALQVGSTLIIPGIAQSTPTPQLATATITQSTTITFVATNTPSQSPIIYTISPSATPLVFMTASPNPVSSIPRSGEFTWAPLLPYIQLLLNILSALCLIASCFCLLFAIESYQRANPYIRRRRMGSRVRSGL